MRSGRHIGILAGSAIGKPTHGDRSMPRAWTRSKGIGLVRRLLLGIGAGAVVAAVGVGAWMLRPDPVVRSEAYAVPVPTGQQLTTAAETRFFFAHQSVGESLVSALPEVFEAGGVDAPPTVAYGETVPAASGVVIETMIGVNGDPIGKVAEFDRILRDGLAEQVDVALLKLCFVDIHAGTDVEPVFEAYRDTLDALERDFPDVTFMYSTVPLMHERDLFLRAKRLLGRGAEFDPIHNVTRERLNGLLRAEYGATGRLFDPAKMEAAGNVGRVDTLGSSDGEFLALRGDLATDSGHLTHEGAVLIAGGLVSALADAVVR